MALPLGKILIVIGAGAVGTYLANEGGVMKFSDIFSGALKVVVKSLKEDEKPKGGNEGHYLMAQVNSVREELQMLLNQPRHITVLSGGSQSGVTTYAVPVVCIGVAGYGYIWWKGWKISDLMFATKRSLSDACGAVGKQLDQVSVSLAAAKRHLSSKIDRVDKNLDECAEINAATKQEVGNLRVDFKKLGYDVESVHRAVIGLESKIGQIEGKQDVTNQGVYHLCQFVHNLEQGREETKRIKMVAKPAIEGLKSAQTLLPAKQKAIELPASNLEGDIFEKASTSNSKPSNQRTPILPSSSGLKGFSDVLQTPSARKCEETKAEEQRGTVNPKFEWKFPGLGMNFLQRSQSTPGSNSKGVSFKP